jgi:hypothetical protein
MNSVEFYGFKSQSAAIPSFDILRFDIRLFCGSLLGHVSYERRLWPEKRPV